MPLFVSGCWKRPFLFVPTYVAQAAALIECGLGVIQPQAVASFVTLHPFTLD